MGIARIVKAIPKRAGMSHQPKPLVLYTIYTLTAQAANPWIMAIHIPIPTIQGQAFPIAGIKKEILAIAPSSISSLIWLEKDAPNCRTLSGSCLPLVAPWKEDKAPWASRE